MRKVLVLLLAVMPCLAYAYDWQVIRKKENPHNFQDTTWIITVDRDSISTEGNKKQVWWKETFLDGNRFAESLQVTSFDCQKHTFRTERTSTRNDRSAGFKDNTLLSDGKQIPVESDDEEAPWDYVFAAVCLNKWQVSH